MQDSYIQKKFQNMHALVRQDIAAAYSDTALHRVCLSLFELPSPDLLIKQGSYKTIFCAELFDTSCIIKNYKNRGILRKVKATVAGSRARREFLSADYIKGRGIPTASPILIVEKKRLGAVRESAVAFEFIKDARELRDFFFYDRATSLQERWRIADDFGRLTALIFQASVYQYDLALNNFLIRREGGALRLYFIDCERVQVNKYVPRRQKIDVLARLGRVGAEISLRDRMRFLRGYCAQDSGFAPDLRSLAAEMIDATLKAIRKDCARGRLTSIYTHARYDRIQQKGRTGLCRKELDQQVLIKAVSAFAGRQETGQLVIRHEGAALVVRALSMEPGEAEVAWAAITALAIAGAAIELPYALVCSEITGCLVFDPQARQQFERFLSGGSRGLRFVLRHFAAEIALVKSLLAKI